MRHLAHLKETEGKVVEQSLKSHCEQTAVYAAGCLNGIGLYNVGYLSGILHDMGKATNAFMNYLEKSFYGERVVKGSVIHSYAGVIYILEKFHDDESDGYKKLTSEIIAYAIGAHHGLFDCVDLNEINGFEKRLHIDRAEIYYDEAVENFLEKVLDSKKIEKYFEKALEEIKAFCRNCSTSNVSCEVPKKKMQIMDFHFGLLVRLVTSAVIYGDRRDTREFMQGKIDEEVDENIWEQMSPIFEAKIKRFPNDTKLNSVRANISQQCFEFAKRSSGIYRLNVPTGAGKTLSTLRYAIEHAKVFHKKRVIFIIPLLSVIDQNVKVIKQFLDNEDIILEHHSNVLNETSNDVTMDKRNIKCLHEDWNRSHIIISTLVQLLEILFSHKTSAIGRMQALSDSVIIIDEIQSLPKKTIEIFNVAMNFLKNYCNTTIVLSSATQPCLETIEMSLQLSESPDMVQLSKDELSVFERTQIIEKITSSPYGMGEEEFEEFCKKVIMENDSLLIICNTREEARSLFGRLDEKSDNSLEVYHLSTSMCKSHRAEILTDIQQGLEEIQKNPQVNKKIICVSTQLVEAGIDFSFQSVIRILAGLDNLVQAAGRCNRSNEYSRKGKVYFVKLRKENLDKLQEIKAAQGSSVEVLKKKGLLLDENILGEQAIQLFYQGIFKCLQEELKYPITDGGEKYNLINLLSNKTKGKITVDKKGNVKYKLRQPFKTAAKFF